MGADPEDPQSIANVLADDKGIPRPDVTVDPRLAVSQTEGDHITLPVDATTTAVIHEMEHVGEKAGINPPPPEGDQATTAAAFMFAPEAPREVVLANKAMPGFSDWAERPVGPTPVPVLDALAKSLKKIRGFVMPEAGASDQAMDVMGKIRGAELKAEFMMAHDPILKAVKAKFNTFGRAKVASLAQDGRFERFKTHAAKAAQVQLPDPSLIKIKPVEYQWTGPTFAAKLAAGTLPTVFEVPFTDARTLGDNGQLADLTAGVKALPYYSKYNKAVLAEGTDSKGRIVALPKGAYAQGLHYNRKLFAQAGLHDIRVIERVRELPLKPGSSRRPSCIRIER
jgi:hypothetical protein